MGTKHQKTSETPPSTANQTSVPDDNTKETALANARLLITNSEVAEVLPYTADTVTTLTLERFQSKDFMTAGYQYLPEHYGDSDRSLTTVTFGDKRQVFIVSGKISSGNPSELGHAAGQGMDLRATYTVVYAYDGLETITEYGPDGQATVYSGEYATPSTLLPHLMRSMGTSVGTETFTE